jgi:hypothetical protein
VSVVVFYIKKQKKISFIFIKMKPKKGKGWIVVRLGVKRMGSLSSTPRDSEVSPLPVPKAGYRPSTMLLLDTQLRSFTILVWLYETFIVCKTFIARYVAVEI